MPEIIPPPEVVLETREALLQALTDTAWHKTPSLARYSVKSLWLCNLIERLFAEKRVRFAYNSEVACRARLELGLPAASPHAAGDESGPLGTLIYNAQQYVASDYLVAEGYEPFTRAVVDRAFHQGLQVEFVNGARGTVRQIGTELHCMVPRCRTRAFRVDGTTPVRLVRKGQSRQSARRTVTAPPNIVAGAPAATPELPAPDASRAEFHAPLHSPWGPVQMSERLADGIYQVSTAGHGGWMVARPVAAERLTPEARPQGESHAAWLCFEEDCAWAVPAWELPELWPAYFKDRLSDPWAYLLATLSRSYPDYLLARGVTPAPEPYAQYLAWQDYERRRAAHDPDLIVSCSGDWATGQPGVDSVTTADGRDPIS